MAGDAAPSTSVTASQRWLARLAFVAALAAVVVLLVGGRKSVAVLTVGVLGLGLTLAGAWWFLSRRGVLRWLSAALALISPLVVIGLYISQDLLWAVALVLLLAATSVGAARAALVMTRPPAGMPERQSPPPTRPFLIMNPRSGGGKVGKFRLDETAIALGAEVALLDGPGTVDVAELARRAVTNGADLLGVAGGDGTQALVAGIAAENDLPFLVVSAGTRNHFAMDLGLDRDHPDADLEALTDGLEMSLDLGVIGGRTFVNNASFGAYAEVVQSPAYRDDKGGTTLQMLPDLLSGERGPELVVRIDGEVVIRGPKALLVSNNPYELDDLAGLGRRARLDTGTLGVVAVTVDSAAQAAGLLRGRRARGLRRLEAREVVVESDAPEISVGIDGEAVRMPTPVRCTIRPLALRVRVSRTRPGVPLAKRPIDRSLLRHRAVSLARLAGSGDGAARHGASV
ncbi:MAG: diacylglycerol kinase family protein [Dermatophilaceae bacterium]